jgi:two-component system cell cycle response regulator
VGGTVQKVLQRRDGEKGYGVRVKRALLPSLLLLSYAGLIIDLPSTNAPLWFAFCASVAASYSYFCFARRQKKYTIETLLSLSLLLAGSLQLSAHNWLHLVYVPYLIVLSTFYGPQIIIPLSLALPLFEIRRFTGGTFMEEAFFAGIAIVSGVFSSVFFMRIKRERDMIRKRLDSLKEEAENIDVYTPADAISSEGLASQHLSAMNEADMEIREVLILLKHVVSADAVHMYVLRDGFLRVRCSSEPSNQGSDGSEELITSCMREKRLLALNSKPSDKGDRTLSRAAAPLMDGDIITGALTVHRYRSFGEADGRIIEMFSRQISGILKRHRIYSQLRKEHLMLKKLKEGGSRLISSLRTEDIAGSLIDAAYSIAPQRHVSMALFAPKDGGFEIIRQVGFPFREEGIFDLTNTRLGLVSKSREPDYISDLRNEKNPVLPFKIIGGGSVLMLPLSYEKELLGILVFLSQSVNALRPYQIELLKVLCNQASSSMANARFHAEIERMAVTDGLTGLFNHRNFQEKLSEEFRRLQRFPEPFSLLLIDIDFFKKINDVYGHPAGDEVLRGVARVLKETVRDVDVAARYGGEEFAVILLGTNHEGALNMAERLRRSVGKEGFALEGKEVKVTISVGAATAPYDTGSKEDLIEKTDKALYHAKRSGRNRCVAWREIG